MGITELKYLPGYAGATVTANRDTNTYSDNIINHATEYNVEKGTFVTLTGYVAYTGSDNTYLLDTYGNWVHVSRDTMYWDFDFENRKVLPHYTKKEAQRLVNIIIKNNKAILRNNLLCARFSNKLTAEQREQVRELQNRLMKRNTALQDDGLCEGLQSNYPAGYSDLQPYLDKLMAPDGVGSVTVAIIVSAVVIASLSTAAYFAYKYFATQSEDDVKFSKELTRTLTEKLTDEEYQQLMQETKGIVTKAKIKQSLATVGGEFKLLGIAAAFLGGYMLYKRWQD